MTHTRDMIGEAHKRRDRRGCGLCLDPYEMRLAHTRDMIGEAHKRGDRRGINVRSQPPLPKAKTVFGNIGRR